jgi:hypothetical protein
VTSRRADRGGGGRRRRRRRRMGHKHLDEVDVDQPKERRRGGHPAGQPTEGHSVPTHTGWDAPRTSQGHGRTTGRKRMGGMEVRRRPGR